MECHAFRSHINDFSTIKERKESKQTKQGKQRKKKKRIAALKSAQCKESLRGMQYVRRAEMAARFPREPDGSIPDYYKTV